MDASYWLYENSNGDKELHIIDTNLEALPEEIHSLDLSNLKFLTLMRNKLTDLPALGESCNGIEMMCLEHNCLQYLPQYVMTLRNLKTLGIMNNNITRLQNFYEMKALTALYVDHNNIYFITPEICSLANLEIFSAEGNSLSNPPNLFKLPKMRELNLRGNRLQTLSVEFTKMKLDTLNLSFNGLTYTMEDEKILVANIREVKLEGNFKHEKRSVPLVPTLRLLVIGSKEAGKTSLIHALTRAEYVSSSDVHYNHTAGLRRYYCQFNNYQLSFWDIDDEDNHETINQLFYSDNTLILLVLNPQNIIFSEDSSCFTHIGKWLHSIAALVTKPRFWIICTHQDGVCNDATIVNKVCQYVKEICNKESVMKTPGPWCLIRENIMDRVYCITNTEENNAKSVKTLLGKIKKEVKTPFFKQFLSPEQPQLVLGSMTRLQDLGYHKLSQGNAPVITIEEVDETLSDFTVQPYQRDTVIKYLHERGEVLLVCDKYLVLNIAWFTDILNHIFSLNLKYRQTHKDCANEAEFLSDQMLEDIRNSHGATNEEYEYFIVLAKTLSIPYMCKLAKCDCCSQRKLNKLYLPTAELDNDLLMENIMSQCT